MILHILTTAPLSDAARQAEQAINPGDALLLIEEAVSAALQPDLDCWKQTDYPVFLLEEDLVARGFANAASHHRLATVDIEGFVQLTEQYEQSITWY
ncbi:sulfurtransferase complex subunit TusB [Vreelandella arcis]|uniref:tRNA 2-thiouridine synthesizing protein B n=1 Tax=Vreelandella arcis TaxID=416873 RepID=A0A1G9YQP4_9GAMM|nr:sulfurtransferase complex subunit TusB [Halomonas arcis]SDN11290.1 tRNA 2-thiouridine synthesizing protein B [Halomonas arcis]